MKNYLNNLPKKLKTLVYLARYISKKNNIPAYLVGGFVRDLILGAKNLDLDVVLEGDGVKFAEEFSAKLNARVIRHKRFGTATVYLKPHLKIDIASARKEFYMQPGSLPEVSRGTLQDDLFRRDFTINAMAISINGKDFGRFIDFFDGISDLKHKKIRILHNLSFIDDPTRMFRGIRFEQRYGFRIDANTLKALKEAVNLKILERIHPKRLSNELVLILKEKHPVKYLRRIQQLLGFDFITPRLSVTRKTYDLLSSIESEIKWFNKAYPKRRPLDTWLIYFMGLIDSLDIDDAKSTCQRFFFRKGEEKRILDYKKISDRVICRLIGKRIMPSKIFRRLEPLSYEVILLIKAKCKNPNTKKHIENFFEIYNGMRTFISGQDLHGLGVIPGPYYQKIFAKVLNAKLNGKIKTRQEELALIKKLISIK
jgi:tRNA nucleotidyltransferase (CCA-adding enzyme)